VNDPAPASRTKRFAKAIGSFVLVVIAASFGRALVTGMMASKPVRAPLVLTVPRPSITMGNAPPVSYTASEQVADEKIRDYQGRDQKAAYAMGALYGFYISNTWAIEDYCKSHGVEIPAFIAAFRQANAQPYQLAKNILTRLDIGGESELYQKNQASIFAKTREATDASYAAAHLTPEQGCQSLQDYPDDAVSKALFAKLHPLEMKALQDFQ
jgi:hypothetical protein